MKQAWTHQLTIEYLKMSFVHTFQMLKAFDAVVFDCDSAGDWTSHIWQMI
jgi:hypothetical protein